MMDGKALRKYVCTHLSDLTQLRKQVPLVFDSCASNPAKLVLDATGCFYLNGSRAYLRPDSHACNLRRASILLLEFYILSGCPQQPDDRNPMVRKEANKACLAWRSRLIAEGGIDSAGAVDALGLVLFLASFGIPQEFRTGDLYSLLRLSNLKKKADIFRRSSILNDKLPDIIKDMIAKEMLVEVVDLIFAFELEQKFPPLPLLSSFTQKCIKSVIEERREAQCSMTSLKLQDKNHKRKAEDVEPLQMPEIHVKQPWLASVEASHGLVDGCRATGLLSGNMHGPLAGWWHGNGAVHENSIGYNLFGMPHYLSGNGSIGTSATAGRSFSYPLLPRSSSETGERNLYQFADSVLEQELRYGNSRVGSGALPTATNPGNPTSY